MRLDSAFDMLGRRVRHGRLVVVHDPVMLGLDEMLEVEFDRLDRVLLADEVRRLFADHHLRGVRVAAHRARYDGSVGDTQASDAANAETFRTSTSVLTQSSKNIRANHNIACTRQK